MGTDETRVPGRLPHTSRQKAVAPGVLSTTTQHNFGFINASGKMHTGSSKLVRVGAEATCLQESEELREPCLLQLDEVPQSGKGRKCLTKFFFGRVCLVRY